MVKRFLVIPLVVVAVMGITAVAQAASLPSYEGATQYSGLQVRPSTIWLSGDGSSEIGGSTGLRSNIHWTSWTAANAYGYGMQWLNDCIPYCAAGHFHGWQVSLHAYRPAWVHGTKVFTRLTVTYPDGRPPYSGYKQTNTASVYATYSSYADNYGYYYHF
jgi:hypothetical protein